MLAIPDNKPVWYSIVVIIKNENINKS